MIDRQHLAELGAYCRSCVSMKSDTGWQVKSGLLHMNFIGHPSRDVYTTAFRAMAIVDEQMDFQKDFLKHC